MVYFIFNQARNIIKIGTSSNPEKRLGMLQTGGIDRLELLGSIPGGLRTERKWHKAWRKYRVGGEWFQAAEPLKAKIRQIVSWHEKAAQEQLDSIAIPPKPHEEIKFEPERNLEILCEIFNAVTGMPELLFNHQTRIRRLEIKILIRNMRHWGVYPFPRCVKADQREFDKSLRRHLGRNTVRPYVINEAGIVELV